MCLPGWWTSRWWCRSSAGARTAIGCSKSTRAFALEKLTARRYAALARRLCEHMTIVFERAERTWPTTARADWLATYEPDLDNLRAALGWSLRLDGDPCLGVKLVGYTDWLWRELALLREQRRWFELGRHICR